MPGWGVFARLRFGSNLQKRKSKKDIWTNLPTETPRVPPDDSEVSQPTLRIDFAKDEAAMDALNAMVAAALRNGDEEEEDDDDDEGEEEEEEEEGEGEDNCATARSYASTLVKLDEARRNGMPQHIRTKWEQNEHQLKTNLHRKQEEASMRSTPDGQSWLLAREVLQVYEKHKTAIGSRDISTVAVDDLVFLAKRFLECRRKLAEVGRPHLVTIAYHYTRTTSMESIRENGLMTPADQQERKVTSGRTGLGGTYGPGIYLSSNPYAFHSYNGGDVGLMVAVIYGKACRLKAGEASQRHNHDTVVGNKCWEPSRHWQSDGHCHFSDEYVLQTSAQCLPLFRFNANVVEKCGTVADRRFRGSNELIWAIHEDCQKVFDCFMNHGAPTALVRIRPTDAGKVIAASMGAVSHDQSRFPGREILPYKASDAREHPIRCTDCSGLVALEYGESPSGTMTVTRNHQGSCDESDDDQTSKDIVIQFDIPSGQQKCYHPRPRQRHCSASTTTSLPDNDEGRALLVRLKYAWLHGKAFRVERSIPFVAWSSAPFKHRIPDDDKGNQCTNYCTALNLELDAIGVPSASVLKEDNGASASLTTAKEKGRLTMGNAPNHASRRNPKQSYVPHTQILCYTPPDRAPRTLPQVRAPCPHCGGSQFANEIGACPPGTMTVTRSSDVKLGGIGNSVSHTFTVRYDLPSGVQKSYHPNPGVPFQGTSRTAYIPDNDMGRMLLDRLKCAWLRGLTFTVGRSMTTGRDNQITWSSISHKTSVNGGLHGFPDPNYFAKVNAELDAAGVPTFPSLCSTDGNVSKTTPHSVEVLTENFNGGSGSVNRSVRSDACISCDSSRSLPGTGNGTNAQRKPNLGVGHVESPKSRIVPSSPSISPRSVKMSVTIGDIEETRRGATVPSLALEVPDEQILVYNAPETLLPLTHDREAFCDRVPFRTALTDECAVCLEPLNSAKRVVRLRVCRHDFHEECVKPMQRSGKLSTCPICRKPLLKGATPRGASPSGTMKISRSRTTRCRGFDIWAPTFIITYHLPKGVQKSHHPSPGLPFASTTRMAYLPDTKEGRQVLIRLKHAWMHGLCFLIGTSMTSGATNVIVWSSIHHKTNVDGRNAHSFPDPNYFANVNKELDNLNVPSWDECQKF